MAYLRYNNFSVIYEHLVTNCNILYSYITPIKILISYKSPSTNTDHVLKYNQFDNWQNIKANNLCCYNCKCKFTTDMGQREKTNTGCSEIFLHVPKLVPLDFCYPRPQHKNEYDIFLVKRNWTYINKRAHISISKQI